MKKNKNIELAYTRKKVSKINQQLYKLLERRFTLTNHIGQLKQSLNKPVEDKNVEKDTKEKLPKGIYDAYISEIIDKVIEQSVLQQNRAKYPAIILMGMPGCGKTTIAKAIAEETGRKFSEIGPSSIGSVYQFE